ncbi:MAG: hypothetical protein LBM08_06415, partial [Dysgonamonadaceae bacterium]|nr:hypothetical protein [Dysgonamonadaceae bacterium]
MTLQHSKSIRTFCLCGILFAAGFTFQAAAALKNLRVEYMRNPIGIDATNPRFSWEMDDAETGKCQTAYQITLLAADKTTEVWTSGKIASDVSLGVNCDGATLSPSTRYFW